MQNPHWSFPYSSVRMPVFCRRGVATSQPLAAQAGFAVLREGGNAIDAAIATAITLTVVEPNMNGIGSDAFAIVWDGEKLHGLNASGRSPAAWTPERFAGMSAMPTRGWESVTVPGCVSAWAALSQRFGRLPFTRLFEDAIRYAQEGFIVPPIEAANWAKQAEELHVYPDYARDFLPHGRAPQTGERFQFPAQANTLREIAETQGESFYRGELAKKIAAHAQAGGAALTEADLAAHQVDWVEPLQMEFHGYTLHEIPPSGQGIAALIGLGILKEIPDFAALPPDSVQSVHYQIEAMKLAFAEVHARVADPEYMQEDPQRFLQPAYLASRAKLIDPARAQTYGPSEIAGGGTVYLTAVDDEGRMVSFIQSNYMGFGSGIVVPDTGISLQNRGCGFSVVEGHPNRVGPSKRPYHTILPAFVTQAGQPVMSFGVMGAIMQPQGHIQMMVRMALHHQNPQAAVDGPRWQVDSQQKTDLEPHFGAETIAALRAMGHTPPLAGPAFGYGGAQLLLKMPNGAYCGASDARKDGLVAGD
jgi:gamma-glutamyltranspeptidase / glutathione hydrolase